MNKDWFEQALKAKLPQEANDFNIEAAWAGVEAKRRKKRRVPFWWLLMAGALASISVGVWYTRHSEAIGGSADVRRAIAAETERVAANFEPTPSRKEAASANNAAAPAPVKQMYTPKLQHKTEKIVTLYNPVKKSVASIPAAEPGEAPVAIPLKNFGISNRNADLLPVKAALLKIPFNHPAFSNLVAKAGDAGKKRRREPDWWIGAGAFYGLNQVKRSGDSAWVQNRNGEEKTIDFFQAGIDIRRRLSGNWHLQSGLYFSQWTDVRKFSFEESQVVVDSNHLVSQIIHADGQVENIYGLVDVVVIRKVTSELYNRYRFVEVPLLVGIGLPVGEHWQLDCSAGPSIGLLSIRSGHIAAATGAELPLQDAPYRNSGTISGMARVEWMYRTGPWSAGIGLSGRIGLSNWAESGAAFKEKRNSGSVGLVLRRAIK